MYIRWVESQKAKGQTPNKTNSTCKEVDPDLVISRVFSKQTRNVENHRPSAVNAGFAKSARQGIVDYESRADSTEDNAHQGCPLLWTAPNAEQIIKARESQSRNESLNQITITMMKIEKQISYLDDPDCYDKSNMNPSQCWSQETADAQDNHSKEKTELSSPFIGYHTTYKETAI